VADRSLTTPPGPPFTRGGKGCWIVNVLVSAPTVGLPGSDTSGGGHGNRARSIPPETTPTRLEKGSSIAPVTGLSAITASASPNEAGSLWSYSCVPTAASTARSLRIKTRSRELDLAMDRLSLAYASGHLHTFPPRQGGKPEDNAAAGLAESYPCGPAQRRGWAPLSFGSEA
jgi:hypothetical protein